MVDGSERPFALSRWISLHLGCVRCASAGPKRGSSGLHVCYASARAAPLAMPARTAPPIRSRAWLSYAVGTPLVSHWPSSVTCNLPSPISRSSDTAGAADIPTAMARWCASSLERGSRDTRHRWGIRRRASKSPSAWPCRRPPRVRSARRSTPAIHSSGDQSMRRTLLSKARNGKEPGIRMPLLAGPAMASRTGRFLV